MGKRDQVLYAGFVWQTASNPRIKFQDAFSSSCLHKISRPNSKRIFVNLKFLSFVIFCRCEPYCRCHTTFNTFKKMTTIEDPVHQVQLNQAPEPDSDTEDDPGKLLNAWLGQLNQKVNIFFVFFFNFTVHFCA